MADNPRLAQDVRQQVETILGGKVTPEMGKHIKKCAGELTSKIQSLQNTNKSI